MKKDEVRVKTEDEYHTKYTDPVTKVSINGEEIYRRDAIKRCRRTYLTWWAISSVIIASGTWWISTSCYFWVDDCRNCVRSLVKDAEAYRVNHPNADLDGDEFLSFRELKDHWTLKYRQQNANSTPSPSIQSDRNWLRTRRLGVRLPPGVPLIASEFISLNKGLPSGGPFFVLLENDACPRNF